MNYMKQMTGYERFGQAMSLIKLLIIENSYNDITVVAPGNNWKDFAESLNPKRIIDRDMFLNYENKDVIFDDVTIEEKTIITFHGEKLYPMNLKFPNHNHIIVVELSKLRNGNLHSGNCTTHIPDLDYETFTHNHYPTLKVFYT